MPRGKAGIGTDILTWVIVFLWASAAFASPPPPQWVAVIFIEVQNKVGLKWNIVPEAREYIIFRSQTKGEPYLEIGRVTGPQLLDYDIKAGKMYCYALKTVTPQGESEFSLERCVTIPGEKQDKLTAPIWEKVEVRSEGILRGEKFERELSVILQWEELPFRNIVAYNVFRKEAKGGDYVQVASVSKTHLIDKDVKENETYMYYLTALNDQFEESPKSIEKTVAVAKQQESKVSKPDLPNLKLKTLPSREKRRIDLKEKVKTITDMHFRSDGKLVLNDGPKGRILLYDPQTDQLIELIGKDVDGAGRISFAFRFVLDDEDSIYVPDSREAKLLAFDKVGQLKWETKLERPPEEILQNVSEKIKGDTPKPSGITIDPEGKNLYVSVPNFNTIYVFTKDGEFVGHLGHGGSGPDDMKGPSDLVFNSKGELYVSEPLTHLIRVVDVSNAETMREIGRAKTYVGAFIGTAAMTLDPEENLIQVSSAMHAVQVFDGRTGAYLYHIGGPIPKADPAVQNQRPLWNVTYPGAIAVDKNGDFWIYMANSQAITVRELLGDRFVAPRKDQKSRAD